MPSCASFYRERAIQRTEAGEIRRGRCIEMPLSDRERQLWTNFVREREQRKDGTRAQAASQEGRGVAGGARSRAR
jgi:hypothetical protein